MVQIIEENRQPSFIQAIMGGIAQNAAPAMQQFMDYNRQQLQESQANEAAKKLGLDTTGFDPDTRRVLLAQHLKGQQANQKNIEEQFLENKSYDKIKDSFGEKFADIWKAAPTGGKTELLKHGIDAKLRGQNVDQLLQGVEVSQPQQNVEGEPEQSIPQMKNGQMPKDYQWPDFTKRPGGYSPKDWIDERKTWRKENSPVFLENKTKLQNSKRDSIAIKKLDKLNSKMPEGYERLIINPETGEPYGVAQLTGMVSPEVQEWVKETARFQNRAKDAFGSRVTNFDLVSYMKQFPGLLNTQEGRSRIVKMMGINNELDQSYESALQSVYQKYGLNGIPMEEADKLAQSMIHDETDRLTNEYLQLDEQNQTQESPQLSGRMVDVVGPDGQTYEVDEREVEQLPEGFRII